VAKWGLCSRKTYFLVTGVAYVGGPPFVCTGWPLVLVQRLENPKFNCPQGWGGGEGGVYNPGFFPAKLLVLAQLPAVLPSTCFSGCPDFCPEPRIGQNPSLSKSLQNSECSFRSVRPTPDQNPMLPRHHSECTCMVPTGWEERVDGPEPGDCKSSDATGVCGPRAAVSVDGR